MKKLVIIAILFLIPNPASAQYTDQEYTNFIQQSIIDDSAMHSEQQILETQSRQLQMQESIDYMQQRLDEDQLNRTMNEYSRDH